MSARKRLEFTPERKPKLPIRFIVGHWAEPRSATWEIWSDGGHVYVAMRHLAPVIKISIHASGVTQAAVTKEHIDANPAEFQGERRPSLRMKRTLEPFRPQRVVRIIVPFTELRAPAPAEEKASVLWIDPRPGTVAVEFDVVIAHKGHPTIAPAGWPEYDSWQFRYLTRYALANGDYFWLTSFYLTKVVYGDAYGKSVSQHGQLTGDRNRERNALFLRLPDNSMAVIELAEDRGADLTL